MAESFAGAVVRYCGHRGVFVADIYSVAGANVVVASREVPPDNLDRTAGGWQRSTHQLMDFPTAGYWSPRKGVFVVPADQVKKLTKEEVRNG